MTLTWIFDEAYDFVKEYDDTIAALVLAFINILCFVPIIVSLIFRGFEYFHQNVTSDIPGNVHAFDSSIISLFRTLPEPNNFNVIYTSVPFDKPLVVKGSLPHSRISSLSVYGQGSSESPSSLDFETVTSNNNREDKSFEVLISNKQNSKDNRPRLDCKRWRRGMVVMRNYLVPPGTAVITPDIYQVDKDIPLRKSDVLVSGPSNVVLRQSRLFWTIPQVIFSYWNFFYGNYYFRYFHWDLVTEIVMWSLLYTLLMYILMFLAGHYGLRKFTRKFTKSEKNKFFKPTLEESSQTSQPSALHSYWIMEFDVPKGCQLSITGKINTNKQKYWSIVPYNVFGLPLPQFVYDVNVSRIFSETSSSDYQYDIRFCNGSSKDFKMLSKNPQLSVVDISKSPKGYALFRLVHPVDINDTEEFSTPSTRLIKDMSASSKLE